MRLPLNRREFDLFLSHAHKDKALVAEIYTWLTKKGGFKVWYDAQELAAGALLATDLQKSIERCRGILILASEDSLQRGWVEAEYNSAMDERANDRAFRVVLLRLPNAKTDNIMKGISWIDVPGPHLDVETALSIVKACYPGDKSPKPGGSKDIYISCSWHSDDSASARAVCRSLAEQGFRLIGDAKDQEGFGKGDRVERIIESCGGFVGIVPFRGEPEAVAGAGSYKYFLREMELAAKFGLPAVIVADPRVRRADGMDQDWLKMGTTDIACPRPVTSAIENLWDRWRSPSRPHYVFYAADLKSDVASADNPIRHLVERITGMHTVVGSEINAPNVREAIMESVCGAFLVLADITDDNINACIEAGMAAAVRTNLELSARGAPRRPPFMLGDRQLFDYQDEVARVGIVRRIAHRYRRRVINAEL